MNGWSEDELAAAVDAYRQMQSRLASGSYLEKAKVYRELAARHGRTPKAWEYRMQNISHVLDQAGESWLPGLPPAANVGAKVEMQLAILLTRPSEATKPVAKNTRELLEEQTRLAEATGAFSIGNAENHRERVLAAIVRRRGQPSFRNAVLAAYGGRCAMTGCDVTAALEAAHIHPYSGPLSNVVFNGLLLRADLHTLFDLHLIAVEPNSRRIAAAPALHASSYSELEGRELAVPSRADDSPRQDLLAWHRARCEW